MKLTILLISFIFSGFYANAQQDSVFIRRSLDRFADTLEYKEDTVLLENSFSQILVGTMILPGRTSCLNTEYEYGYGLDSVFVTPCNITGRPEEEIKVDFVTRTDTTLSIQCKIVENCCHEFLCEVEVLEDSILNLKYLGYGSLCACFCCFGLNYSFTINNRVESYSKIKQVMINEDRKTLFKL